MQAELVKRRSLYVGAAMAWVGTAPLTMCALATDASDDRVIMIYALVVASTLTLAALFVSLTPPREVAYQAGYEAGQRASGCSMYRPTLSMVRRDGNNTTTPIRVLHTDS